MVDLKSLAQDLTDIPKEVKQSLENGEAQAINSHKFLYVDPKNFSYAPELQKKMIQERKVAVEELPSNQLPFAIDATNEDKNLFIKFTKRFFKEVLPEDCQASEEERKILATFGLLLSTNVDILNSKNETLEKPKDSLKKLLPDSSAMENSRMLFEQYANQLNIDYCSKTTDNLIRGVVQYAINNNFFGDLQKNENNFLELKKFIEDWAKTLSQFSKGHDVIEEKSESDLIQKAAITCYYSHEISRSLKLKILDEFNVEYKKVLGGAFGVNIEKRPENDPFYDLGDKLGSERPEKSVAILNEQMPEILKMLEGKSIEEVVYCVESIHFGVSLDDKESGKKSKKITYYDKYNYDGVATYFPPEYFSFMVLKKCILKLPQFENMSEFDKKLMLFNSCSCIGLGEFGEVVENNEMHLKDTEEFKKGDESVRSDFDKSCLKEIEEALTMDFAFEGSDLSHEDVKKLYDTLNDNRLRLKNFEVPKREMVDELFALYLNKFFEGKNYTEVIEEISLFENDGVHVEKIISSHLDQCYNITICLVEAIKTGETDNVALSDLIKSSTWIANPFLQRVCKRFMLEKYLSAASFQEKLDTFLPEKSKGGVFEPQTQEVFFENEVNTQEQFKQVKSRIEGMTDSLTKEGSVEFGVAALVSNVGVSSVEAEKIMEGLLTSFSDDSLLKSTVFEELLDFKVEKMTGEDDKDIQTLKDVILSSDDAVRSIYNMDGFAKQLFLRKLLTEKKGVLPEARRKRDFLNFLFGEWLQKGDGQESVFNVLDKIRQAVEEIPEWQLVYFGLQSVLADKIAVPPSKSKDWASIYDVYSKFSNFGYTRKMVEDLLKENIWKEIPDSAKGKTHKYARQYSKYAQNKMEEVLSGRVDVHGQKKEKLSPIKFVKEFASKTGTMGVRFLQLLPQFVELDKSYEEEFSEVYDGLKGQSKLAALALLEREWPDVWQEFPEIGKRIGGGSAMTVYEATNKDGHQEVIKVRNPNVSFHLAETHRFASKILESLSEKYGDGYKASRNALDDINDWVLQDINFDDFLEKDKTFYEQNNGFKPEGFDYSIKVPKSKEPASKYFMREEKVVGKNLTKWNELVENGKDMKQVVGLLVKNYINQISNGQVHSDVHVGNFCVTENNEVVIFDRNFYLDVTEEEQGLIASFISPFGRDADKKLFAYLKKSSGDIKLSQKVMGAISGLVKSAGAQNWAEAQRSIVGLKQEGVKIPLKFTLFIKNFNSLQMIASKAGFKNLSECFMYQPA